MRLRLSLSRPQSITLSGRRDLAHFNDTHTCIGAYVCVCASERTKLSLYLCLCVCVYELNARSLAHVISVPLSLLFTCSMCVILVVNTIWQTHKFIRSSIKPQIQTHPLCRFSSDDDTYNVASVPYIYTCNLPIHPSIHLASQPAV